MSHIWPDQPSHNSRQIGAEEWAECFGQVTSEILFISSPSLPENGPQRSQTGREKITFFAKVTPEWFVSFFIQRLRTQNDSFWLSEEKMCRKGPVGELFQSQKVSKRRRDGISHQKMTEMDSFSENRGKVTSKGAIFSFWKCSSHFLKFYPTKISNLVTVSRPKISTKVVNTVNHIFLDLIFDTEKTVNSN